LRDRQPGHLETLEDNSFAVLRLVKGLVVVVELDGGGQVLLAPLGHLKRGVTGVDLHVRGSIAVVENALILLFRPKEEHDGVVH